LQTAEELSRRAATALDHARLFAHSQAAQKALEQSNAELRRANADLEQFAFSASHDLQEPLRMVGVYSQMLSRKYKGKIDAKADEYLGFMVEGAHRMESLIRDLLAYTRVVTVAEPAQVEPVDTCRVLQIVILNLQGAIEASGARVTWGSLPMLAVDDVHLVQLFQNLIGNAIKYRGEQPPVVHVTADRDEAMWKVCVQDNGIGVDPRFAGQIFGIFRRLHRNDEYSGTGIGLAICQKIVNRYGGRIWVESTGLGEGSTFCFTLPGPQ
jgi:light-regulated signal transduction histidine kinase (bacteriophytochrome)